MAYKEQFSADEWNLMREAAVMVSSGVEEADTSSLIGKLGETRAFIKSVSAGQQTNPLIEELGADESDLVFSVDVDLDTKEMSRGEKSTYIEARAIDLAQAACALADAKVGGEHAAGYRKWLYAIAEDVAKASKEGFLGLFGPRVSEPEAEFLTRLKAALGL